MKIKISILLVPFLILLYFFDLLDYYIIVLLSIILHEVIHCIVGRMYGMKIVSVSINICGCNVLFDNFNILKFQKVIVLMSGPLFNIILATYIFVLHGNYYIMFINLFLGIFNLLPVYPLDGGKILYLLLNNQYICNIIKYCFIIISLIIISLLLINNSNIVLFFLGIYILVNFAFYDINNIDKQI